MSKMKSCYNCQWSTEHPPLPPGHLGLSEPGYFTCAFVNGVVSTDELDQEIAAGTFDCLDWELSLEEADIYEDDLSSDHQDYLTGIIARSCRACGFIMAQMVDNRSTTHG